MPEEKKARRSGVEMAKVCKQRLEGLKGDRTVWEPLWDELARYIMPRKADQVYRKDMAPGTSASDELFDTTAVYANQTLANGQLSYMTPADSRWFTLDPPQRLKDDDKVAGWFAKCSEIMQAEIASSNFYSEIHELYFDDGGFGTSVLIVLEGKSAALNFETLAIGTYWIAENDEGLVDTLFRELHLTANQAAQKFGEDSLSPKMKEALAQWRRDGKPGPKFCICHGVFPREASDREQGKLDGQNKPWASVYWVNGSDTECHTLKNEGFDEKPFFAVRHLKWGESVYGYCPGWMALPEARQVNFLTKQMDALAEVAAFPRFLAPSSMVDEIDLRAGGMTIFDENQPNAVPKEWMTQGRYDVGLDREKRKASAIERAFHVDLFQMFANYDGPQMTAREVSERAAEKLIQFTPAFARKTTELLTPALRRIFGILLRAGKLPPPPQEILVQTGAGPAVPDPDISYNSRVALAIKALQNVAFFRAMELVKPIADLRPEVLDNYDFDKIARESSRNDGLPEDWLLDKDKVEEIRKARAAAQEQMMQAEQAKLASEAARNVGTIQPGSMAGQAIASGQ